VTTINDVLRFAIRGGPNTEENQRRMLETIDAHEKGYGSLEEYQEELARQDEQLRRGNQAAMAVEQGSAPDPRDAELASLRAQLAAREPAAT